MKKESVKKFFKRRTDKEKFSVSSAIMLIGLLCYALILITLLLWGFSTSLKLPREYRLNKIGIPEVFRWENYTKMLEEFNIYVRARNVTVTMTDMYINSILYAVGCSFTNMIVPCITAYLCAKYDFRLSKLVYTIVIITMIIPIVGSLPSEVQLAQSFGLYNQIWGLWIMKGNFLGFYFLIFYSKFRSMSNTYTEAARIDGASDMQIMLRIMLPLAKNTMFCVMLILFIGFWNDYQTPLLFMPNYPTISIGLYHIVMGYSNNFANTTYRMAGAMLVLIPILIFFIIFNDKVMGNLTIGGIKE